MKLSRLSPLNAVRGLALAAALTAAAGAPASAADEAMMLDQGDFVLASTQDLYEICSAKADSALSTEAKFYCLGYFTGAVNYHQAVVGPDIPPIVCAPENTTIDDVIGVFVNWAGQMKGDPEAMAAPPIKGAMLAAISAWPCTR